MLRDPLVRVIFLYVAVFIATFLTFWTLFSFDILRSLFVATVAGLLIVIALSDQVEEKRLRLFSGLAYSLPLIIAVVLFFVDVDHLMSKQMRKHIVCDETSGVCNIDQKSSLPLRSSSNIFAATSAPLMKESAVINSA